MAPGVNCGRVLLVFVNVYRSSHVLNPLLSERFEKFSTIGALKPLTLDIPESSGRFVDNWRSLMDYFLFRNFKQNLCDQID